jgi:cystathionine beta-lyase/cystathionine gamma-synthase
MLYKKGEQSIEYQQFTLDDYLPFKHEGLETIAIHEAPEPIHGSINVPIHMSTTYAQKDINEPFGKFDYTRGGNPTREALESCLGGI